MNKKKNHYNFEFTEVLTFLFKWRKHLLIITLVAAVLAAVISSPLFITPQYQASSLFYPGTTNSISSTLFYTIKEKAQDPLMFGDEEVDEQYIQLLESGELKSKVMRHFNLMEHYNIDTSRRDKYTALYRKYDNNVKCRRTNYNSIEISVMDENPRMAADIANGIMAYVDTVKHDIQGRMARQIYAIVKQQFEQKEAHIDSLKARMRDLGIKGVYLGIKGVYNTPQTGLAGGAGKSSMSENGAEYVALEEELSFEVEHLANLRLKYEQAKVDMEGQLSNIFVIGYASPPESKAYPIRSVIIIISSLAAFVMACVVLVILEKYQQFRKNIA